MSRFVLALSFVVTCGAHTLAQSTTPPPTPAQAPPVAVPVTPVPVPAPATASPVGVLLGVPVVTPRVVVPVTPPAPRPAMAPAQATTAPAVPLPGQRTPPTPPPAPRAQTPKPAPSILPVITPPGAKAAGPVPANVKIELTISDTYGSTATQKTVMMLVADGNAGRVRSSNHIQVGGDFRPITINVDAIPEVRGNAVLVHLTIEYTPEVSTSRPANGPPPATVNESIAVVLASGEPAMISQSADPATDRKVTVVVTATVMK